LPNTQLTNGMPLIITIVHCTFFHVFGLHQDFAVTPHLHNIRHLDAWIRKQDWQYNQFICFEKNTLSVQNFIRNSITEKGVEKRGLCPSVVELVFSISGLYTASQIKSVSFQVVYFVGISWHSAVLACLMPRNLDCL
jgi:hypothetical protein